MQLSARAIASALVALVTGITLGSCHDSATSPDGNTAPAAVHIVTGDGQTGVVGAELAQPIVAKVVDASGRAVAGQPVNGHVIAGGGSMTATTAVTNTEGLVQIRWKLGPSTAESQRIGIDVLRQGTGAVLTSVEGHATPMPGPAASLSGDGGNGQSAQARSILPEPAVVRLVDQYGNPISGVSVQWTVVEGGGSVTPVSPTTDAEGRASARWTLGAVEGENRLTATAAGLTATFSATTLVGSGVVQLALQLVTSDLTQPLYLTTTPIDDRLFVVEQGGRIRIVKDGALLSTPFLDIASKVSCCGERGLLSVAFHPQYATNGFLYVAYTTLDGDVRVERYHVSSNPDVADVSSAKPIIDVPHRSFSNHNGGLVAFGPDGMLYVGIGDGGGNLDAHGQDLGVLLGKLLRLDVDHGDPYAIPSDNPFVGRTDARGEIWAYGLRNPWRWAFDVGRDRLYMADVGQSAREEIDVVGAHAGGLNYGWSIMEGYLCYNSSSCDQNGLVLPVIDYDYSQGCSITGGYVYRGTDIPELTGHYFYSDFCGGWLRSLRVADSGVTDQKQWPVGTLSYVTSFGVDRRGELYLIGSGSVMKIVRGS